MTTAVVEVLDLLKTYPDGTEAVRGISFQVQPGEIFGFLGPNGAGKSTTVKMLTTLMAPTDGDARIFGHDIKREAGAVRSLIGYAAQDVGIDDELTGRENLQLVGGLYGFRGRELQQRGDELLALVALPGDSHRPPGSYSGGMRKWLALATGLVHRPQLLFLDA